jgi:hypothetical protein
MKGTFMFNFEGINYLAVVVATLINAGLGSWWYSPSGFGRKWTKLTGVDLMKSPKGETNRAIMIVIVGAAIQAFVLAIVLNTIGTTTIVEGAVTALLLWLGFIAATSIGDDLYSRRGWKFWWLNASFFLIVMLVSSVLLAVWR